VLPAGIGCEAIPRLESVPVMVIESTPGGSLSVAVSHGIVAGSETQPSAI